MADVPLNPTGFAHGFRPLEGEHPPPTPTQQDMRSIPVQHRFCDSLSAATPIDGSSNGATRMQEVLPSGGAGGCLGLSTSRKRRRLPGPLAFFQQGGAGASGARGEDSRDERESNDKHTDRSRGKSRCRRGVVNTSSEEDDGGEVGGGHFDKGPWLSLCSAVDAPIPDEGVSNAEAVCTYVDGALAPMSGVLAGDFDLRVPVITAVIDSLTKLSQSDIVVDLVVSIFVSGPGTTRLLNIHPFCVLGVFPADTPLPSPKRLDWLRTCVPPFAPRPLLASENPMTQTSSLSRSSPPVTPPFSGGGEDSPKRRRRDRPEGRAGLAAQQSSTRQAPPPRRTSPSSSPPFPAPAAAAAAAAVPRPRPPLRSGVGRSGTAVCDHFDDDDDDDYTIRVARSSGGSTPPATRVGSQSNSPRVDSSTVVGASAISSRQNARREQTTGGMTDGRVASGKSDGKTRNERSLGTGAAGRPSSLSQNSVSSTVSVPRHDQLSFSSNDNLPSSPTPSTIPGQRLTLTQLALGQSGEAGDVGSLGGCGATQQQEPRSQDAEESSQSRRSCLTAREGDEARGGDSGDVLCQRNNAIEAATAAGVSNLRHAHSELADSQASTLREHASLGSTSVVEHSAYSAIQQHVDHPNTTKSTTVGNRSADDHRPKYGNPGASSVWSSSGARVSGRYTSSSIGISDNAFDEANCSRPQEAVNGGHQVDGTGGNAGSACHAPGASTSIWADLDGLDSDDGSDIADDAICKGGNDAPLASAVQTAGAASPQHSPAQAQVSANTAPSTSNPNPIHRGGLAERSGHPNTDYFPGANVEGSAAHSALRKGGVVDTGRQGAAGGRVKGREHGESVAASVHPGPPATGTTDALQRSSDGSNVVMAGTPCTGGQRSVRVTGIGSFSATQRRAADVGGDGVRPDQQNRYDHEKQQRGTQKLQRLGGGERPASLSGGKMPRGLYVLRDEGKSVTAAGTGGAGAKFSLLSLAGGSAAGGGFSTDDILDAALDDSD